MRLQMLIPTILLMAVCGCAAFDKACIFGQATPEEAKMINEFRAKEHTEAVAKDPNAKFPYPDHCIQAVPEGQHGGDTDCEISDRTRYFNGACSGALQALFPKQ